MNRWTVFGPDVTYGPRVPLRPGSLLYDFLAVQTDLDAVQADFFAAKSDFEPTSGQLKLT